MMNQDNCELFRVATDLYRAVGVPAQRSSYALLFVNSVFMGLYFMHEDISDDFVDSRFKGDGSGNLMQLYYNVHLGFYGSDDTYYREKAHVNSLGANF
jgi:spore coat protein CotH